MAKQNMGTAEWEAYKASVSHLPVCDVGIGTEAGTITKLTPLALGKLFRDSHHDFIDGGANVVNIVHDDGTCIRLYVRRRGNSLDVGTRQDFADMGWEGVCDSLDAPMLN